VLTAFSSFSEEEVVSVEEVTAEKKYQPVEVMFDGEVPTEKKQRRPGKGVFLYCYVAF
jgi:hypothetical protein